MGEAEYADDGGERSGWSDRSLSRNFDGLVRIPADADPDWAGRARLLVGGCVVVAGASLAGAVWTHVSGLHSNRTVCLVLLLSVLTIPFVLRKTQSLPIATHLFNTLILIGMLGLMWNTQGRTVPPFICISIPPMLGALIAGSRAGFFWAGVAALGLCFGFSLVPEAGAPLGLDPELEVIPVDGGKAFGSFLMLAVITATCTTTWRLRCEALAALSEAKDLANERYKQVLGQQADLEKAQTDDARIRDEFFSHVSHELRTPLTPLHQFVSLVLDEVPGPISDQQREYLQIASRNASQMDKLIGDLTDAARVQSGVITTDVSVVEPRALIAQSIATFAREAESKSVELSLEGRDDLQVLTDPRRTQRILKSLLENAIRVAPEGSRVDLTLDADPSQPDSIVIGVRDRGPGIDPESRERLFESMRQVSGGDWQSRQGLGLGLYIARALVEQLGGRLWFEEEKRPGATFYFSLPRYSFESTVSAVSGRDEGSPVGKLGVVVVLMDVDSSQSTAAAQRAVRAELKLLLYPHVDVLLPIGAAEGPRDGQVALTRSTSETLPKIVGRLRAHFEAGALALPDGEVRLRFVSKVVEIETRMDLPNVNADNAERVRAAIDALSSA